MSVSEFQVDGLRSSVDIRVDTWGVPHIRASNRWDVYVAQGFNAARDRLFQIDIWRRRGNGLLAEALGSGYVAQDRANRLLLYRGDMDAEWAAYGEGVRDAAEAFVTGINAYIDWALAGDDRLPPEFALHGFEPSKWEAADLVRFRTHGLFYNVEHEMARVRTLRAGGEVAEQLRQAREPADPLEIPNGLDLGILEDQMLTDYRLAFAPVSFDGVPKPDDAVEGISGSNNWVVSSERTATGRPLLANDPHRAVTLPSLRYLAHLQTPDLNVIGAGEPGLPGISIGHNERLAFGLTIWPADVEDLYLYSIDEDGRYLGPDGSAEFEVVEEEVPVRGGGSETVELQFTVHGPVIHVDTERRIALALRAAWLEPGMAPYMGSIGYSDAANADDFVNALSNWGAPAVNHVFAGVDGDFGWQVAAKIPERNGWDGSLPVPGDGTFEWGGFVGSEVLPGERRPVRGYIATSNEENLPESWDNRERTATYDWYSFARAERLEEWLSQDSAVSIERSNAMQMDSKTMHGLQVLRNLADVQVSAGDSGNEFARLLAWDGVETADSRDALVFEVWVRRHLRPALVEARLSAYGQASDAALAAKLIQKDESFGGDLRGDLALTRWAAGHMDSAELSRLVDQTLGRALGEIASLVGDESEENPWSWGRLHHAAVSNPAFAQAPDAPREWRQCGPLPQDGSGDTVGMAGYDGNFRQSIASTFRMSLDVGEWDNSLAMNSPGQSGDPRSRHYGDLFEGWVAGDAFPLVYSDSAVEAATQERITLRPAE